jgi:hypothetical protein
MRPGELSVGTKTPGYCNHTKVSVPDEKNSPETKENQLLFDLVDSTLRSYILLMPRRRLNLIQIMPCDLDDGFDRDSRVASRWVCETNSPNARL